MSGGHVPEAIRENERINQAYEAGRDQQISTTMALGKVNGDWFKAIVAAQAAMGTVGKDGKNTSSRYNYATAENMIRGSREPLTVAGLAFFSTWSTA